MAIHICADFKAGASFTPSQVIATKYQFFFNKSTIMSFSSGTTLAMIFVFPILSKSSDSGNCLSSIQVIIFSGFFSQICFAICCAVVG